MIRIVVLGLGAIGTAIARVLAARADVQLVGGVDADPAKVGQDLGEVIGLGHALGVAVAADAPAVLRAARPDVVVQATGSRLAAVASQIRQILRAGCSLLSTCEELSFPFETAPELADELDRLARAHNVALLGTGVNPGFAMDTLPLALTALSQRVDAIAVVRIQDVAARRLPLQKKVGVGLDPAEFAERARAGTLGHVGLRESVGAIAHGLAWTVERFDDQIEPVVADREIGSAETVVAPGQVLGLKQTVRGIVDGAPRITLDLQLYLGAPNPHDRITIEGVPRVDVSVNEGTHGDLATAAIVVNAIPSLLRCEPGLRVMEDLPLVHYQTPVARAREMRRVLAF